VAIFSFRNLKLSAGIAPVRMSKAEATGLAP
jgi:hypothetical protein